MPHVFEPAPTGRAKCRGCSATLARGEWRFGERMPSPFGDGEMTLWFHPQCAAYKRPEAILQALAETPEGIPERETLERTAQASSAHRRLQRIDGAERAPSSQAKCRHCKQPIPKGAWRIRLVFFEEGRFMPSGFLHLDCRGDYFEGHDPMPALMHFSAALSDEERRELAVASAAGPGA